MSELGHRVRRGTGAASATSDAGRIEHEICRLEAELEAEVDERSGELAAALDELTAFASVVAGAARLPLEVSTRRINELVQEMGRLSGLLADLGGRPPKPGSSASGLAQAFRSAARRHPQTWRRIAGLALACLVLCSAALTVRPDGSPPSSPVKPPAVPAPRGVATSRLFARSTVALLSGLPGNYTFDGGTSLEQDQVTAALAASGFDWYLIPDTITVHIVPNAPAEATPGNIWLSPDLLNSGTYAWGFVQHEYAHQVDFFLLSDQMRAVLKAVLGASAWCYGNTIAFDDVEGLQHAQYGCERFASTLAWSYWPFPDNAMKPLKRTDESAGLDPGKFRALLGVLLGAPNSIGSPSV